MSGCGGPGTGSSPASSSAPPRTPSSASTPAPGPIAPAPSSPRPARRAGERDPSTIDELTPQELQIALLLTAGKTTRETAAALFLSPKTVEYHLRHVYQKLGIHSRDELAHALATQLHESEQVSPRAART